ncbi:hypothetical protein [Leisingera sp. ANG-DT]|uniref:hypothetical protein n=1 Tax=Leisingera sp. ANG-DT TaxID=1577897 RepID=UPI00057F53E9|nr:hypothetical protein [Leisingera sp. ANG-DT]KIC17751.1 hypothetical protein RA21_08585 [Leisingera sp. ANG-DT]
MLPGATIDVTGSACPAQALIRAIGQGKPGVRVIYARDWFLADRRAATAARALFEQGQVHLVQERIRTGRNNKFAYIAIKRTPLPTG